jgi:rod shape-determining protein MreC
MNILKLLIVIVLISTLFVIEKLDLYIKIPGFEKIHRIYLSQQDICGNNYIKEEKIAKIVLDEIAKKMEDLKISEYNSSVSFISQENYKVLITKIISIPPDKFPKEAIIYGGLKDGIKKYSLVAVKGKLFGRVIEVYENSSKIITVFSPNFYVDTVFPNSKIRAILKGSPDGKMKIFASSGPIEGIEGEEATTSGNKFSSPAGIKIGKVKNNEVEISFDLTDILYVSIIVGEENNI